jgi:sarcosine oxidase
MATYDVAVIGLGATGSAALMNLALRGARTIGIEQFEPGHDRGSSHGETRIIRLGYFEHPSYVPLLRRTYTLWRELEARAGRPLMHITGIVEMGLPESEVVSGTLAASREHGLPHEVMDAGEAMRRFPAFRIPQDFAAVFQPDGGFLAVEPSIAAMIGQARAAGATVRTEETVLSVSSQTSGVRLETTDGPVDAGTVIVAAGAWLPRLMPGLSAPLRPTRQVQAWFRPEESALFAPDRFPVFLLESAHGTHYGFPDYGGAGIKIARHHHADETTDPDSIDRDISGEDEAMIRAAVAAHIPSANGAMVAAKTCLYTVTPDHHFIIDRLPGSPNIVVASACSGHGFKFAPVLGEALAQLALDGATTHDLSRFRLGRFG